MERITDHQSRALRLLYEQFKDSTNLRKLISALVGDTYAIQELEDQVFKLLEERSLNGASGKQLDLLGEIAGQERLDADDDRYRQLIRIRIAINVSNSTPEELLTLLKQITQSDKVSLLEEYPAHITMWAQDGITTERIARFKLAVAAGVGLDITSSNTATPFVFAGDDDGEGFGETGGFDDGGNFSELWTGGA